MAMKPSRVIRLRNFGKICVAKQKPPGIFLNDKQWKIAALRSQSQPVLWAELWRKTDGASEDASAHKN